MRCLAEHDLGIAVPCIGRGDEIGAMAEAVQAARQQRSDRLAGLVTDFERQIGETVAILTSASIEMEATARSMTGSAEQTD